MLRLHRQVLLMKLSYAVFIVAVSFLVLSLPSIAYEREDLRLLLEKSVNSYGELRNTVGEKEFRDLVRLYFETPKTGTETENKTDAQIKGTYSGKSYDTLIS